MKSPFHRLIIKTLPIHLIMGVPKEKELYQLRNTLASNRAAVDERKNADGLSQCALRIARLESRHRPSLS